MSEGKPIELAIRPTIDKNRTSYEAQPSWVSCDRVRFQNGKPEKIGGWVSEVVVSGSLVGVARDGVTWENNSGKQYLAVGTHKKLEIFFENQWYDITPIRTTVTAENITTSVSSSLVVVSASAHGATAGDYVIFSSMSASVGNVKLNGEYEVTSVIDSNSFLITYASIATLTSNGGGAVVGTFLLPSGRQSNEANRGYGGGTYGTPGVSACAGWSDPRTSDTGALPLRQWSLDNWGQDLLANPRGGALYHWGNTGGVPSTRASIVTSAPVSINFMKVNIDSRQVLLYGTLVSAAATSVSPNLIRWSDIESFSNYSPTSINAAGDYVVPKGGELLGFADTKFETLLATRGGQLYLQKYTGPNDYFDFEGLEGRIIPASQHSMISIENVVYAMGLNGFYKYDGTVKRMISSLDSVIFTAGQTESLNFDQKEKVFVGSNTEFTEIIWLYPADDSTEISRYVIYNYQEDSWYDGTIDRTIWLDSGIYDKPYAVDSSSVLYIHEQGHDADASAIKSFIISSDIDVESGNNFTFIDKLIPDFRLDSNLKVNFSISGKKYNASTAVTKGPFPINNTTEKVNPRLRARQFSIRYSSSSTDSQWKSGDIRLFMRDDGKR